jgi:uncharacterized membrane protein YeaQ/YmgE (transglycosylase-associated protein family)
MLGQAGQPGVLGAVLLALAGGWVASRLLRAHLAPFPALVVGLLGSVLGMLLLGLVSRSPSALWLLTSSVAGSLILLMAARVSPGMAEKWRNRNRSRSQEFEKRSSTGRSQENT